MTEVVRILTDRRSAELSGDVIVDPSYAIFDDDAPEKELNVLAELDAAGSRDYIDELTRLREDAEGHALAVAEYGLVSCGDCLRPGCKGCK